MPSVDVHGITIEYQRDGSGDPLLLVMGLGGQLTTWPADFVDALVNRGFEVIRFDNRDSGLSSASAGEAMAPVKAFFARLFRRPIPSGYLIDDMADDAVGLLDALGVEKAHVVGASMGGMIAQAMAIRHEHRVASLTSIMSNPGDGSGGASAKVYFHLARRGEMNDGGVTRDEAIDQAVATFGTISGPHFDPVAHRSLAEAAVDRSFRPEGTGRQFTAIMASGNRVPDLEMVRTPTLVVHGMVDPLIRPSGGMATAAAIPGSRLLLFPDMGHDLPTIRQPEIADAIVANAARAR